MLKKVLFIVIFCVSFSVSAQVTNEGIPASWKMDKSKKKAVKTIHLPQFDMQKVQAEDKVNDNLQAKPWRFGYKYDVDYGIDNAGEWIETKNGDRIWRVLFESKGARSLNFIFDEFYMPKGGKVYLYNDDRTDLLGAYTDIQNQKSGVLGTWLVKGSKVWIEYFEPKEVIGKGKLHIANATHGYRTKATSQKALDSSGDCNHDVDCTIGADADGFKEHNKKAVSLILINGNGHCTGTLINNTNNDKTPYLLTANHCLTGPTTNWAFRFGWISPNPDCGTTAVSTNGPTNMTISGSTLRVNNSNSDVALLELNSAIPDTWDRVWAGWDRTDNFPMYTVGIHHPSGDIMKVARDNDVPAKIAQNAGGDSPVAQTWDITGLTASGNSGGTTGWEIGVTEGGSSGSALFNENGLIIGQLYGGAAECTGTNDNNGHDYYGRFGVSWDAGGSAATQLEDWLDPAGTNPTTLESFPELQVFPLDGSVVSRIPPVLCGNFDINPTIVVRNAGSSTLTSLTINWDVDGGTSTVINWTGSLAQNETEDIILSPITVSSGSHTFNVSSSNPNGSSDQNATNNESANSFSLTNEYNTNEVKLSLLTDDFSDETTWQFRDSNGNIIASGGPYNGTTQDNTVFDESFNVVLGNCYTFEIFDDEDDGICCGFGNGSYSLKTADDTVIFEGGNFGSSEATQIRIDNSLSIDDEFLSQNITVFPNPTSGILQINKSNLVSDLKYEVYNVLGQTLKANNLLDNIINLNDLSNNIYFVKIIEINTNSSTIKKVILNK